MCGSEFLRPLRSVSVFSSSLTSEPLFPFFPTVFVLLWVPVYTPGWGMGLFSWLSKARRSRRRPFSLSASFLYDPYSSMVFYSFTSVCSFLSRLFPLFHNRLRLLVVLIFFLGIFWAFMCALGMSGVGMEWRAVKKGRQHGSMVGVIRRVAFIGVAAKEMGRRDERRRP